MPRTCPGCTCRAITMSVMASCDSFMPLRSLSRGMERELNHEILCVLRYAHETTRTLGFSMKQCALCDRLLITQTVRSIHHGNIATKSSQVPQRFTKSTKMGASAQQKARLDRCVRGVNVRAIYTFQRPQHCSWRTRKCSGTNAESDLPGWQISAAHLFCQFCQFAFCGSPSSQDLHWSAEVGYHQIYVRHRQACQRHEHPARVNRKPVHTPPAAPEPLLPRPTSNRARPLTVGRVRAGIALASQERSGRRRSTSGS